MHSCARSERQSTAHACNGTDHRRCQGHTGLECRPKHTPLSAHLWTSPVRFPLAGIPPYQRAQLLGSTSLSHGEKCTAQFVLAVWNPDEGWKSGKFNLMEALRAWDDANHKAFLVWAADPWWA